MTDSPAVTDTQATTLVDFGSGALAACRTVLQRADTDDLARTTPCAEFTVGDLRDHLVRSMVLLAGSAGARLETAGGATLDEQVTPVAEAALSAWQARGFDGEVPLGSRTLPAMHVYAIVLLELVVHGWDLDRALGATRESSSYTVAPLLVDHLIDVTPALIRPEARGRAFADAVPVGDDAPPLERLIAFTGRRP